MALTVARNFDPALLPSATPARKVLEPGYPKRLFYEPYYQLTRQTLLAARAVAESAPV